jgi:hypothetical protein
MMSCPEVAQVLIFNFATKVVLECTVDQMSERKQAYTEPLGF